jgi:hypothetical protein
VTDYLMPGGNLMGVRTGSGVRNVSGGTSAAQAAFDYLKVGGRPYTGDYAESGEMVVLPGNIGLVGLRNNKDGIPTLDVNVPSIARPIRFHYPRD